MCGQASQFEVDEYCIVKVTAKFHWHLYCRWRWRTWTARGTPSASSRRWAGGWRGSRCTRWTVSTRSTQPVRSEMFLTIAGQFNIIIIIISELNGFIINSVKLSHEVLSFHLRISRSKIWVSYLSLELWSSIVYADRRSFNLSTHRIYNLEHETD